MRLPEGQAPANSPATSIERPETREDRGDEHAPVRDGRGSVDAGTDAPAPNAPARARVEGIGVAAVVADEDAVADERRARGDLLPRRGDPASPVPANVGRVQGGVLPPGVRLAATADRRRR